MSDCKPLTPEELATTNGCGSSHSFYRFFRIPFFFKKCCNRHDIRYQTLVTQEGKDFADDEWLNCMYYDAFHGWKWLRNAKLHIADLAYWGVTKYGGASFGAAGK